MALFGLYTGEISVRSRTIYRQADPALFWLYFVTNLSLAAMFLFLGLLR
jgi:hypothetical protein